METQTHIARTMFYGGGGDALALKQNRLGTFTAVEAFFAAPLPAAMASRYDTIDGAQARRVR